MHHRTIVFPRELSEIKHFSPISSWRIVSSMGLLLILVDLVLLGRIVLGPQFGCQTNMVDHGKALADEGCAEKVTVRQAVTKVAWARNCHSSPLEIATGRRPPDLFDVETSTPEQLSANPSDEDCTTLDLQRIAMRLIRRPDNHLISERILLDGLCRLTVPIRKEIVCLFGARMMLAYMGQRNCCVTGRCYGVGRGPSRCASSESVEGETRWLIHGMMAIPLKSDDSRSSEHPEVHADGTRSSSQDEALERL